MNLRRRFLLSALMATAAMTSLSASAQQIDSIVGAWELLSLYDENGGEEVDIFGPSPKGRLTLDSAGSFSLMILTDTPLISPACDRSTGPITRHSIGPGMIAYYGSYKLRARNTINFRVDLGLTGGWKRSDRKAEFDVAGSKLTLVSSSQSLTGSDYSRLTWRRINNEVVRLHNGGATNQ